MAAIEKATPNSFFKQWSQIYNKLTHIKLILSTFVKKIYSFAMNMITIAKKLFNAKTVAVMIWNKFIHYFKMLMSLFWAVQCISQMYQPEWKTLWIDVILITSIKNLRESSWLSLVLDKVKTTNNFLIASKNLPNP